jgi:hypothetical protein
MRKYICGSSHRSAIDMLCRNRGNQVQYRVLPSAILANICRQVDTGGADLPFARPLSRMKPLLNPSLILSAAMAWSVCFVKKAPVQPAQAQVFPLPSAVSRHFSAATRYGAAGLPGRGPCRTGTPGGGSPAFASCNAGIPTIHGSLPAFASLVRSLPRQLG